MELLNNIQIYYVEIKGIVVIYEKIYLAPACMQCAISHRFALPICIFIIRRLWTLGMWQSKHFWKVKLFLTEKLCTYFQNLQLSLNLKNYKSKRLYDSEHWYEHCDNGKCSSFESQMQLVSCSDDRWSKVTK